MYVIQIAPSGERARVWLDPANRSPVYVVFSECPTATSLTITEPDTGTYEYRRSC